MKQSPEKPRNIAFILRKVELYRQGLLCFQKNSSATLEKAIFFKKEAFQISEKVFQFVVNSARNIVPCSLS